MLYKKRDNKLFVTNDEIEIVKGLVMIVVIGAIGVFIADQVV